MNQIYRAVCNAAFGVRHAGAKNGNAQGKSSAGKLARSICRAAYTARVTLAVGMTGGGAFAQSLPNGSAVVVGSGAIVQAGQAMTATKATAKLSAGMQSFTINAGSTVNFVRPSASTVALRRMLGSDVSVIQGALDANRQVCVVNPNEMLFTLTAQVSAATLPRA